jgi:CheY-like chemotaxis protein
VAPNAAKAPSDVSVVYLTNDLVFSSRVAAAGRSAGVPVRVAATPGQLVDVLQDEPAGLLLLDLTTPGLDPAALLASLDNLSARPRIVAYAPHVMTSRLQAARDAGCVQVLTRGQFHSQLEAIVASIA